MWQNLPLFPEQASTVADDIDLLYFFLVGLSVLFSVLITVLIVVFSTRYRRRADRQHGAAIEGSLELELLWTAIPLGIVLVIFAWGAKLYYTTFTPPADALDFYVTGKQWMWKIQHPTGQREINDLHVPAGRPIRMTMSSEDVIHSFYIPAFRVKKDVLPGRFTQLWFEATKPGEYHLFCAEYCGTKHSEMVGTVYVLDPIDYEAWLAGEPAPDDPVAAGAALWEDLRCNTCHSADDDTRGPILHGGFGGTVTLASGEDVPFDADYLRTSILEPTRQMSAGYPATMPTYRGQLSEEDLAALVAYVRSLAEGSTQGKTVPPQPGP